MIIEKSPRFNKELEAIVIFIATDSPNRALSFYDELISKLQDIPLSPFIYRQKEKLDDENIRELIFKSYVIPFLIDTKNDKVIILGVFNQNQWKLEGY
jgi:plasmid stabilization system protein ParE